MGSFQDVSFCACDFSISLVCLAAPSLQCRSLVHNLWQKIATETHQQTQQWLRSSSTVESATQAVRVKEMKMRQCWDPVNDQTDRAKTVNWRPRRPTFGCRPDEVAVQLISLLTSAVLQDAADTKEHGKVQEVSVRLKALFYAWEKLETSEGKMIFKLFILDILWCTSSVRCLLLRHLKYLYVWSICMFLSSFCFSSSDLHLLRMGSPDEPRPVTFRVKGSFSTTAAHQTWRNRIKSSWNAA